MCHWICPQLPDKFRNHTRYFRVPIWKYSYVTPELPRICFICGTVTDLLRPSEFGQFFEGSDEYFARHLSEDIEMAMKGECNHTIGPHLLITLTMLDGDSLFFYPCEAVRLLGKEKADQVLNDLLVECRQMLQAVNRSDNQLQPANEL